MDFNSFEDKDIDIELEEKEKKTSPMNDKLDNFHNKQNQEDITLNKNKFNNNSNNNPQNAQSQAYNSNNNSNNENIIQERQLLDFNTLDETVRDTLNRDVMRIYYKLKHVLIPSFSSRKKEELQNWDLWGPLLICLALCIFLSIGKENKTNVTFIVIFVTVWVGGSAIAFNAIFLGAKMYAIIIYLCYSGICQSICLLGYCSFPIMIAAMFVKIFSWGPPYAKVIIVAITFFWSCFSSVGFMSGLVVPEKKFVAVYPVFLFYLALCGFVLNY